MLCFVFFPELNMCGQRSKPEPAKSTSETLCSAQQDILINIMMSTLHSLEFQYQPHISVSASWLESWTSCCHSNREIVRFPVVTEQSLSKVAHGVSERHCQCGNSGALSNEKQRCEMGFPREPWGAQGGQGDVGMGWLWLCSTTWEPHQRQEVQGPKLGW